jgi:hypothetical protein
MLRVLGPVEVVGPDGVVPLGGAKERCLLAVLAVNAGAVVAEDRLVDALWDGSPPRTATKTLQNYVLRLRRRLGATAIRTRAPGYVLDGTATDVGARRGADREGRRAAAAGDHEAAIAGFDEALALWRGPALVEFAGSAVRPGRGRPAGRAARGRRRGPDRRDAGTRAAPRGRRRLRDARGRPPAAGTPLGPAHGGAVPRRQAGRSAGRLPTAARGPRRPARGRPGAGGAGGARRDTGRGPGARGWRGALGRGVLRPRARARHAARPPRRRDRRAWPSHAPGG